MNGTATTIIRGATATDAPAPVAPVSQRDLLQAVLLRVQKERRHSEARTRYWAGMGVADGDEQTRNIAALRFASDEMRRARADLEATIQDAVKGGVAA